MFHILLGKEVNLAVLGSCSLQYILSYLYSLFINKCQKYLSFFNLHIKLYMTLEFAIIVWLKAEQ